MHYFDPLVHVIVADRIAGISNVLLLHLYEYRRSSSDPQTEKKERESILIYIFLRKCAKHSLPFDVLPSSRFADLLGLEA